jgi:LmbE family N-acetylglucosaminyl deacetylase
VPNEPATLNVVAHQDDDLLFLSPDLLNTVRAGGKVMTVYVTAGDAGLADGYWEERESGVQAAYAEIAGVDNVWVQKDAGISGRPVPVYFLTGRESVSLAFMRIPDGAFEGTGYPSRGGESLQKLWSGEIAAITAVDQSSTYTVPSLIDVIVSLIASFRPDIINTLNYGHGYGDGDHSDHHTVAYLTREAVVKYGFSPVFTGYEGYPVFRLPVNVSDTESSAKRRAFLAYAQYDKELQEFLALDSLGVYGSFMGRQYRLGQSRSLVTRCRGLIWRGAYRAKYLGVRARRRAGAGGT